MEARIYEWKKISDSRNEKAAEFEKMRDEIAKQEAKRRQEEMIENRINQIPLRFRNKTFNDYQVTNAEQGSIKLLVERFVETFTERAKEGTSMVLMGRPGTGKTLLSLIMYQELVRRNYSVKYESNTEFLKTMLESRFQPQSSFNSHIEALRNYPLLIIDEVTESITKTGFLSEPEKEALFRVINDRYEKMLCTIVITNRDEKTLKQCIGEPTFDRLAEGGLTLAFNWESYRQK